MTPLLTLISRNPYIVMTGGLAGWAGWLALLFLTGFLLWHWKGLNKPRGKRNTLLLAVLALAVPLTSLFLGLRLPAGSALTLPDMPLEPLGAAVMLFAALPWLLAGGLLGPLPAAGLGALSGLLIALFDTHTPFTPLDTALMATLFSATAGQRYRTPLYRLLRRPLAAALLLALIYPILSIYSNTLASGGALVSRLDYALTHLSAAGLGMGLPLVVGGLFAEVIAAAFPAAWGRRGLLLPSPAEKSLQARVLYSMAPVALVLALALIAGDWLVAWTAARRMLEENMGSAAVQAADSAPYFLEGGEKLIAQLAASDDLSKAAPGQLAAALSRDIKTVPFFSQLYVLDSEGMPLAGYPQEDYGQGGAPVEEEIGLQLALNGVPVQSYTIPPETGGKAARVAFIAAIPDEEGKTSRVLVGRSNLAGNPLFEPVIASLNNMAGEDGQGILLDESGRILYHPNRALLMADYTGRTSNEPLFYEDTGPDGTRRLVYFQPPAGRPWSVALVVPAHRAQEIALRIAAPLLGMVILLGLVAVVVLHLGLGVVTGSLKNLSLEAGRISQGQLDHPLPVDGEDEVGRLRRAFEQMRLSLKARLDELNRLLLVSQGVASSLEIGEAVQPVLESALATGASSARVVLTPAAVPELEGDSSTPTAFGLGPAKDLYCHLDEQILALSKQQDRLVLTSPTRPRLLEFSKATARPEALLAVALRHENLYYGSLWVAYDRPHSFSEEETRFLATLAGQAALAAANTRLFLNAEVGRQRLAAILASSPDPVLVTDQRDRLLLSNPAAWQALGIGMETDEGQPVEKVIAQKELVDLLRASADQKESTEVTLHGDQIYLATASSVVAEGRRVGRVCILRDVTRFKELDALKSEFVSTVSHDLRSPLTLMRGYATMLEMVGQLNEQQNSYVRKIVAGVENMARLVNNLLDLGRIEAGVGLQLELVPIQDVIERVVSALQPQAAQKRIQMHVELSEQTIPLIEADHALLQQALQNLVENAVKYTRAEGRVTVRAHAAQDSMLFEVSDTGIGISPMDQARLFERFYRGAQHGAKDQRGSGLGLAIVKSIAERHGGAVGVESQLGKGSTFTFAIPIRQSQRDGLVRAR